jgi:hypothetical protein
MEPSVRHRGRLDRAISRLALVLSLAGCARPPLVLPAESVTPADLATAGDEAATVDDPGAMGDAGALDDAAARRDLVRLAAALEHAYGGIVNATPELWQLMMDELGRIPTRDHDRASFCDAIGDALSRLAAPTLAAYDESGRRCAAEPTSGGTISSLDAGANLARDAATAFVLDMRPGSVVPVPILAIRSFDPDASWEGWDAALETAATAAALVIDLRGARGGDAVHGRALVERITSAPAPRIAYVPPREPVWAERLRAAPAPPAWTFDGEEPEAAPPPRNLQVLIDGGCEDVCEAVAYALARVPGARLAGQATSGRWLSPEEGVLVLPASRVHVRIPLARRVVTPHAMATPRIWPHAVYGSDALPGAWAALDGGLALRARVERLSAETHTCEGTPARELAALPLEARQRLGASLHVAGAPGPGSAIVSLHPGAAAAFVASCEGVRVSSTVELSTGQTAVFLTATTEGWSRLAQHDVVEHLELEPPVHLH